MKKFIPLLTILVFTAFSSTLKAQSSDNANITATANILGAISVTNATDLDFGTFTEGESSTIDITTDTPGKFTVNSSGNANVELSFTLPTGTDGCGSYTYCLDDSDGGGTAADELELVFGGNDGGWDDDDTITNNPTNTFDPTSAQAISAPADGNFAVFVAGQANATAGQNIDTYTGTITLTVAYN